MSGANHYDVTEWPVGDHPPEDSLYLWGPDVPDYFFENTEAA